ncbi:MAG: RagB/SusD family nutrient uptake outer membrane protein [Bacteroidota bacterium]|nr:RagB/SusD family nutrient uptake outer membrane protein [Bacteroidota bacterium]MDP4250145.1 RagB/SusD family nutrient uptake outer membrane protein [Bacteroidota bacterium]
MNKIFNKARVLGLLLISMTMSCEKGLLDKNPTSELNAGTFYNSKNSIDMALAACYATLQNGLAIFTFNMPAYDCLADDGYSVDDYFGCTTLSQGPIVPTSGGYVNTVYPTMYANIATYNIFLQTLSAYNLPDLDAATKATYEAEVRLLRAMAYFHLYKFYGSVPLVTTPLTIKTQYQPKVDATAVLAQINTDIDFAIAGLPDKAYADNTGHLVKSAAEVLKARVLLFDGYSADGTAITDVMAQAEKITSDIISKNYYRIAPSFRGLFCEDLGFQNGNPEFIFSVNYLAATDFPSPGNNSGVAANYLPQTGSEIWPLSNLANEFEFKDGTPFSVSNPLYDASDVYKNRDPRMAKTMFTGTVTFENGFTSNEFTQTTTGYNFYKDIEGTDAQNIYNNLNGSDWPAMRYAEVLLMYAEAANEVDGPSAAVYDAIDQIRNRADILMPPLAPGLSQSQMRTAIRHERRVELAFEGFRYDDLKRWKIAPQALTLPASESIRSKSFMDKNYHLPLPQSEIDINQGVLVQNPDY